jgi:alkanesulfonate monooxygenase
MHLRQLEFGWFLPTGGDTITYGSKDGLVPPSMALFEKIALAAAAMRCGAGQRKTLERLCR